MYQFTKSCMIGVEQLDKEHQHLFELVNQTSELLKEDKVKRSDVVNLLKELNEYTAFHFAHEEEYMEQINDPELVHQKEQHRLFIIQLKQIEIADIKTENDKETVRNILEFVSKWLFTHILSSDAMIGIHQKKNRQTQRDTEFFNFTTEYHTGIEFVDEEHRVLFEIFKRANDLIMEEFRLDKYDEIVNVIEELREYTVKHFNNEEEYMEKINYADIDIQKKMHKTFVDKLENIDLKDLDSNQQEYLMEIVDFLLKWLINHIIKLDKKIPVIK